MCSNQKFLVCKHCGNLTGIINNKGVPMMCCGEKMTELKPNTVEASVEKHLPAVTVSADCGCDCGCDCECVSVLVGSVLHPMEDAHHIAFVYVETENGDQRKCLEVGQEPKLEFCFKNDKPLAVYAYCNQHGLWKTEL
jgi:superoxide reductase